MADGASLLLLWLCFQDDALWEARRVGSSGRADVGTPCALLGFGIVSLRSAGLVDGVMRPPPPPSRRQPPPPPALHPAIAPTSAEAARAGPAEQAAAATEAAGPEVAVAVAVAAAAAVAAVVVPRCGARWASTPASSSGYSCTARGWIAHSAA